MMDYHVRTASDPAGSEMPGVLINIRDSATLPHSPKPSHFIRLTHEQAELANASSKEEQPLSNVSYESEAPSKSDPFDDSAVINSLVKDDFDERTITLRSIIIGLMTSVLGACIAEVFMFKPVHVNVDVLFLQLICLVLGRAFASIPGSKWWNPGPIAVKEIVFSLIMATSASAGVYGVQVIATQDVMFNKPMPLIISLMTLLGSQFIGYGIAGILQPILVYPSEIVFPGVIPVVALFHSMSDESETTKKQISLFKKTLAAISLYEIFPTYLAPALSAVSIWCLALPKTLEITNLFGGSLPGEGMGLMSFSADWTFVGSYSPLFVPLMAQLYLNFNRDRGGKLPFISYNLMDKNGKHYDYTFAVNKDGTKNERSIEELSLPAFATSFVLGKAFLSMAVTASITIGICSSIMSWVQDKKDVKLYGKVSKPCPHREITKKMREFPTYVFVGILLGAIAIAFMSAHFAQSGLTPVALLVSITLASVLSLAAGYFYGTLGINLNVPSTVQTIGGLMFPGNAIGTVWFGLYGSSTVNQCVLMLKDLKLGTYMHLAPFSVVIAQWIGTVVGSLVHVFVTILIVRSQRDVLLMPHGNGIFAGMHLSTMAASAVSWSFFSHELFYPGKIYSIVLYFLCAGFFVPIPFLIFKWFHPKSVFAKFNVSLFIANIYNVMFGANSGQFVSVFVGLMSQFYLRKYHFGWYKKYNYILCAALDGGTQVTVVLLAFIVQGGAGFQVKIPKYFLNPDGPRDYCAMPKKEL